MKKWVAGLLGLVFVLSFFSGCTQEPGGSDDSSLKTDSIEPISKLTNPIVRMNGFETHKELSLLALYEALGKVELNKDKTFVKTGDGSAKVTVTHDPYVTGGGIPSLWQEMHFDATGEDYSDFSNVTRLTLEVYNAQETVKSIGMQLMYVSSVEQTEWFELAPKAWTTVTYHIARELIPKVVNNRTGETRYPVQMMCINFSRSADNDDIFYLDDFNLYRTQEEPSNDDIFVLAEHEIASFDKYWQFKYCRGGSNNESCTPKLSWIQFPEYSERGGVMKCVLPAGKQNTYSYVEFSANLLSKFDFSKYVKSEDEFDLCFDVYLPEDSPNLQPFGMYLDGYSRNIQITGTPLFDIETKESIFKAGWNTVRIPFESIVNNPISAADDLYNITREPSFRLAYLTQKSDTAVLYFDNFRMEKVAQ